MAIWHFAFCFVCLPVCQVRQLETALSSCRDELNSYLQQMEEAKEQYERQLEMKSREVGLVMVLSFILLCLKSIGAVPYPEIWAPIFHRVCVIWEYCIFWAWLLSLSSAVLSAGGAVQHHFSVSELQWTEPTAPVLPAAATEHAPGEQHSCGGAGGEPDPATGTGSVHKPAGETLNRD